MRREVEVAIKYNPKDFNVVSQWNDSTGHLCQSQCN